MLAGCTDVSGTGGKGYISGEGQVEEVPVEERGEPVELTGEGLDGATVSLEDLRGKPVVLNVWWSICGPCIVEQPDLNEVAADLGDTASFVGLNIRDSSVEDAQAYVRSLEVPYPSIYAPDGRALLPFAGTLSPQTVPATLVLDDEGRVAAIIRGRVPTKQTLESVVEKVLDE